MGSVGYNGRAVGVGLDTQQDGGTLMHRADKVAADWQQAQRRIYGLWLAPRMPWRPIGPDAFQSPQERLERAYSGRGDFTFTDAEGNETTD